MTPTPQSAGRARPATALAPALALAALIASGCGQADPTAPTTPVVSADSEAFRKAQAEQDRMVAANKQAEAKAWKRRRAEPPPEG